MCVVQIFIDTFQPSSEPFIWDFTPSRRPMRWSWVILFHLLNFFRLFVHFAPFILFFTIHPTIYGERERWWNEENLFSHFCLNLSQWSETFQVLAEQTTPIPTPWVDSSQWVLSTVVSALNPLLFYSIWFTYLCSEVSLAHQSNQLPPNVPSPFYSTLPLKVLDFQKFWLFCIFLNVSPAGFSLLNPKKLTNTLLPKGRLLYHHEIISFLPWFYYKHCNCWFHGNAI